MIVLGVSFDSLSVMIPGHLTPLVGAFLPFKRLILDVGDYTHNGVIWFAFNFQWLSTTQLVGGYYQNIANMWKLAVLVVATYKVSRYHDQQLPTMYLSRSVSGLQECFVEHKTQLHHFLALLRGKHNNCQIIRPSMIRIKQT